MTWLLVIVALGLALVGFASLTQATLGVGIICAACLLMIWARIVQAHEHRLQDRPAPAASPAVSTSTPNESVAHQMSPKKSALMIAALVALALVGMVWSRLFPGPSSPGGGPVHSADGAYRACGDHLAAARPEARGRVTPYSRAVVTDERDGRYRVAASFPGQDGSEVAFQCDVTWLTGSTYTLQNLSFP